MNPGIKTALISSLSNNAFSEEKPGLEFTKIFIITAPLNFK